MSKRLLVLFVLSFFAGFSIAQNPPPPLVPRSSVIHSKETFNGQEVKYTAAVKETFLVPNGSSSPVASIITTSYTMEPVISKRPVMFVFNGGPGASSSPLHMYAFGPVRLLKSADTTTQVINIYSVLDVTDLVFIDPVGTGFTRVFDEEKAANYWDVKGDAMAVLGIIKSWQKENHRESSAVFICGESYGTIRAAEIAGMARGLNLSGILLFASVLDFSIMASAPGNEMPYLLSLPTMASIAWYHNKIDRKDKSVEQHFAEASQFAETDYIQSLFKNDLTHDERNSIATKISSLIGLPIPVILDHNLRISSADFEQLLLASEGKRIGKLDGRVSKPVSPNTQQSYSAKDDPSLSVNTSLAKDYVGKYFKANLKFPGDGLYKTMSFAVNSKWKWGSMEADLGYLSAVPNLIGAMKEQPQLRLFVAGGYYDLATPISSATYMLKHNAFPPAGVTFSAFPTGHSIFENEDQLKALSEQVRAFIFDKKP